VRPLGTGVGFADEAQPLPIRASCGLRAGAPEALISRSILRLLASTCKFWYTHRLWVALKILKPELADMVAAHPRPELLEVLKELVGN
jgi:hypothetical protein